MRLAQIITLLQSESLLCDNNYRATLLGLLEDHAKMSRAEFAAQRTGTDKSGGELDVEQAEMHDGICVIPVGGPVGIGLGEFEKGAGAVDLDDVSDELDEAEADDGCSGIILNFDSPGGMVNGTFECCDRILACEKPIYSFSRGKICSAAYAMACATDGIFATKSATIGNIGVYARFLDLSRMAQMQGIGVKIFSSGPIKSIGEPGTAMTPEQEMFMQQRVMSQAKMFYDHVKSCRPTVAPEDMGGQFYSGDEAVKRGFVDDLLPDLAALENFLRAK